MTFAIGAVPLKGFPEQFHLFEVVWDDEPATAAAFAARTPYVGREAERAELAGCRSRRTGHGSLVLIGGEPGVGKTRLTEEAGADAAAKGVRVLVGRCYEIEGAPPYVPFVEIFEQALAAAPSPEAFRALLGDDAPEVAKLLPRLRRLFPDIPPPLELPPEQERHFLFNSLRDSLARAAAERPLFLVLDDLHWADEGTLLLLEHLAEHIPRLAVVAVGTYRDTEVTPDHRLARPLEVLLRRRLAQPMSLKRLSEDGVAALLRALSGQEPPPSLVAAVHAETQGNPFFTEEVFKHLAEEGRLYDEDGRFRSEVDIGELDVPRACGSCSDGAWNASATTGAGRWPPPPWSGRAFTYELLEALGELAPDALLDALEEARTGPARSRRCRTHPTRTGCCSPTSSSARRSSPGCRSPGAGACTCWWRTPSSGCYATTLDEQASEIAHHLTQAGPAADRRRLLSLPHARRPASHEDRRTTRTPSATSSRRSPWRTGRSRPSGPDLFAQRGLARRCLGRLEDALPDWDEALRRYEDLGNAEDAARMCLEALADLWWLNRDREAVAQAERGLAALGRPRDAAAGRDARLDRRGRRLGVSVRTRGGAHRRSAGAGRAAGGQASRRVRARDRALHRFAFSLHQEVARRRPGRHPPAAGPGRPVGGVHAPRLHGDGRPRTRPDCNWPTSSARRSSRWHPASAIPSPSKWRTTCRPGPSAPGQPDFDAFEAGARRHLEVAGPLGFRHISATLLADVAFLRGDWDEALQWAEDAVRHSPEDQHTSGMDWACYLRVLAYSGRTAEVHAVLDGRRADFPSRAGPTATARGTCPPEPSKRSG